MDRASARVLASHLGALGESPGRRRCRVPGRPGLSVPVSVFQLFSSWHSRCPTDSVSRLRFAAASIGIAIAFEVAAILATIWLLRRFALSHFLMPAIGFIVGLHFLGLWKATDLWVFVWTAGDVHCVRSRGIPAWRN
jgi:hypothetical protein